MCIRDSRLDASYLLPPPHSPGGGAQNQHAGDEEGGGDDGGGGHDQRDPQANVDPDPLADDVVLVAPPPATPPRLPEAAEGMEAAAGPDVSRDALDISDLSHPGELGHDDIEDEVDDTVEEVHHSFYGLRPRRPARGTYADMDDEAEENRGRKRRREKK